MVLYHITPSIPFGENLERSTYKMDALNSLTIFLNAVHGKKLNGVYKKGGKEYMDWDSIHK